MAARLAFLAPLALVLACGGTTDGSNGEGGGASTGGASAGAGQGGGGKNGGGSSNGGSSNGGVGAGGSGGVAGASGGAGGASGGVGGSYDPRCPARQPMGACYEVGASCDYNYLNGCLCERQADAFTPCVQVDPACTGAGGTGAAPPPAPDWGSGGISTKVVLPPHQRCVCGGTPAGTGGGAGIPAPSAQWVCSR